MRHCTAQCAADILLPLAGLCLVGTVGLVALAVVAVMRERRRLLRLADVEWAEA